MGRDNYGGSGDNPNNNTIRNLHEFESRPKKLGNLQNGVLRCRRKLFSRNETTSENEDLELGTDETIFQNQSRFQQDDDNWSLLDILDNERCNSSRNTLTEESVGVTAQDIFQNPKFPKPIFPEQLLNDHARVMEREDLIRNYNDAWSSSILTPVSSDDELDDSENELLFRGRRLSGVSSASSSISWAEDVSLYLKRFGVLCLKIIFMEVKVTFFLEKLAFTNMTYFPKLGSY